MVESKLLLCIDTTDLRQLSLIYKWCHKVSKFFPTPLEIAKFFKSDYQLNCKITKNIDIYGQVSFLILWYQNATIFLSYQNYQIHWIKNSELKRKSIKLHAKLMSQQSLKIVTFDFSAGTNSIRIFGILSVSF